MSGKKPGHPIGYFDPDEPVQGAAVNRGLGAKALLKVDESLKPTAGRQTLGYEAKTTARIDLVSGMKVRRRAEKWPIYHINDVERGIVFCEWLGGNISCCADFEELQQFAVDGKLLIVDEKVDRLPHLIWRTAKQLVSLLEREYGFGQKHTP